MKIKTSFEFFAEASGIPEIEALVEEIGDYLGCKSESSEFKVISYDSLGNFHIDFSGEYSIEDYSKLFIDDENSNMVWNTLSGSVSKDLQFTYASNMKVWSE